MPRSTAILTPKRRRLTRGASKVIKAMVDTWHRRTSAWSSNGMIGLGIRTGMLQREVVHLAIEQDALRLECDSKRSIAAA